VTSEPPPPESREAPEAPEAPDSPATPPPDPEVYDSPRAVQARARGLAAPYIAGGLDPNPEAARREERRYLRLLIAMIVVLVLAGFVLGYIADVLGFGS
jgi:hypothetical protein